MPEQKTLDLLRRLSPTLSVGIITADLLSLGSELALLERSGVRIVHIDVMDGCFCPGMTVGPPFIKAMKTPLLKDGHLMIADPLDKIPDYVAAGADIVTVHQSRATHSPRSPADAEHEQRQRSGTGLGARRRLESRNAA